MPTDLVKTKVIVAVFLFLSVGFFPSIQIQSVQATQEQRYVEMRSEMCGVSDSNAKTVKLTQEQYNLLRQYLSEFQNRFNRTTTQEEAIPLYKELAVRLAEFNLLPSGMTVQRAQTLMLQGLQRYTPVARSTTVSQNESDAGYNIGCLVSGEVHQALSYFVPVFSPLAAAYLFLALIIAIRLAIFEFVNWHIIPYWWWYYGGYRPDPWLVQYLSPIQEELRDLTTRYLFWALNNPLSLCTRVWFIGDTGTGRIRTLGLLGVKQWDGGLTGIIPPFNDAVIGFSGFKFANVGDNSFFFTGSALAVGVGYHET
jgi:hypothetical protein